MRYGPFKTNKARDAIVLALGMVVAPTIANAARDVSIKLEPGITVPTTSPQSTIYDTGAGQSAKVLFGLSSKLSIGPSFTYIGLPSETAGGPMGTVMGLGVGLQLKRAQIEGENRRIAPWVDGDALYIRTGPLNRPGFDLGAGVAFPIGRSGAFSIGPFVRYLQVMQSDKPNINGNDAKLLTLGLSFQIGSEIHRKPAVVPAPPPPPGCPAPPAPVAEEPEALEEPSQCADADGDEIPDRIDHCPEVAGPMDNWGCPNYDKVIIKKDKLELKEKLYFAWDEARLEPASYPLLDDVAKALNDNKGFRVQVEGHTDSSGGETHNQTLSEQRAAEVVKYLAKKGVAPDRMNAKGFSSSVPTDSNKTSEGRENNRRVEFVVYFIIVDKDGSSK